MNTDISNILQPEEKIVWQGVISRKVLNFSLVISLLIIFITAGFFITDHTVTYTSNGQPHQIGGAIVGLVIILIGVFFSLLSYFSKLVQEYTITQKRVVIKSGLIGTDYKSVYFEQIKEALVDVNLIGKIFSVGTIKIDTGKTETYSSSSISIGNTNSQQSGMNNQRISTRTMYNELLYVSNPYEAYKYINSALTERKESLYSGRTDQESLLQSKI